MRKTNEKAVQIYTRRLIETIREEVSNNSSNLEKEHWHQYKHEMLERHKDTNYSDRWILNSSRYSQRDFIEKIHQSFEFDATKYICKKVSKALNINISEAEAMLKDLSLLEEQEEKERQEAKELEIIHAKELAEQEREYVLHLAINQFTESVSHNKIASFYKIEEDAAVWIAIELKKYLDIREAKFKMLDTYIDKLQEKCMLKEIADLLGLSFKEAKEYVESRILEQEDEIC